MHAVILAGGKGVRLRPYTTTLPKPLVPIGDQYSILEIVMRQLAGRGSAPLHPRDRPPRPPHPRLRRRRHPVGHDASTTPPRSRRSARSGRCCTMPRPAARALPRDERRHPHRPRLRRPARPTGRPAPQLTVATYAREVKIDFGVLTSNGGRIVGFTEKPTIDYRVSMGVYGVSASRARPYTPGLPLGFDELVLDLLATSGGAGRVPVRRLLARHRPARRLRPGQRRVRCARTGAAAQPDARGGVMRCLLLGATGFRRRPRPDAAGRGPGGRPCCRPPGPATVLRVDLAESGPAELQALLRETAPDVVVNCAGVTGGDAVAMVAGNVVAVAHLLAALNAGTGRAGRPVGSCTSARPPSTARCRPAGRCPRPIRRSRSPRTG